LPEKKSLDRLVLFLEILNGLADEKDTQVIASISYSPQINETHQNRIDKVFQFTHENYLSDNINQKLLAKKIFMSESAFSHFFKKATGKTFTYYLNELRIGLACKKLVESDDTIVNICYQSGFQNLSNFNKRFLIHKECTPKQFRLNFIKNLKNS
jgi:AraC-like DNA-binding protein